MNKVLVYLRAIIAALSVCLFLGQNPILAYAAETSTFTQGFVQRQQTVLAKVIAAGPSPRNCPNTRDPRRPCNLLPELTFGLGALYRSKDASEINAANAAIGDAVSQLLQMGNRDAAALGDASSDVLGNSFLVPLALLSRAYFLPVVNGAQFSGVLSLDNRSKIPRIFWNYVRLRCKISTAESLQTWRIYSSENHDILNVAACWAAGEMLTRNPVCGDCRYDDGSTPIVQLNAWTKYLKGYIRERAKYGGFIEFFSPVYYKYTLLSFYNTAEFASDAKLRKLSAFLLDIWFANWAEEQIRGVHGGSKTRVYPNYIGKVSVGYELGWLYFGIGSFDRGNLHPGLIVMMTSAYQPPELIGNIATRVAERGEYEVKSRSPGLLAHPAHDHIFEINAAAGGIARYTFVDPSFVIGTTMTAKIPERIWMPASAQNRWSGAILGGSFDRYVYAAPAPRNARGGSVSVYAGEWGVQYKATQIIQKLPSPFSANAGAMAVHIGNSLAAQEENGWVFVDSVAYVAFRPAFGGFRSDTREPRGFILRDDLAPVIIQLADKKNFDNFAAFKAAVIAAPLIVDDERVQFHGLGEAGTLTFFYNSDRLPEINGVAIDLSSPYATQSPFTESKWGEGVVVIKLGNQRLVRDFRN